MKNSNKTIQFIILALVLTIATLAYFNAGDRQRKAKLEMDAAFLLIQDQTEHRINMQDLLDLKPQDFNALMKTKASEPTPTDFTGVELKEILDKYGIDIGEDTVIQVTALDGYASAITGKEVLSADNVFICMYMNGEPLSPQSAGGPGPYMLVIRDVAHSQRWCKGVEQVLIK